MVDSIDKIANILTDNTVSFIADNGSVVEIIPNIFLTEAIIPHVAAITPT